MLLNDDAERAARLRQRVFGRYAKSLLSSPHDIVAFLLGQVVIATKHLPLAQRMQLAEKIRDVADLVERRGGAK
jgi:hypothetical protein